MSWTRFDDNWSDRMSQLGMTFTTRVHYMAMIQFCSRTNKFDGILKPVDSRRASDVDDPQACIEELARIGLVTRHVTSEGERHVIVEIDQHVPPPHMRDASRKPSGRARTARWRLHKDGDHSRCLPEKCPDASVTGHVTRHAGTGQDGPGLEALPTLAGTGTIEQEKSRPVPLSGVDLLTGEVGDGCTDCGEPLSWCSCVGASA